ncbi:Alanine dehydrogenase [Streptomyces alboniger]
MGAARVGVDIELVDTPADALRGADLVCTTVDTAEPVVRAADLAEGVRINAVGSSVPGKRELDSAAVASCSVFVDSGPVPCGSPPSWPRRSRRGWSRQTGTCPRSARCCSASIPAVRTRQNARSTSRWGWPRRTSRPDSPWPAPRDASVSAPRPISLADHYYTGKLTFQMTALLIGNVGAIGDERRMAEYRAKVLHTLELYGGNHDPRGRVRGAGG